MINMGIGSGKLFQCLVWFRKAFATKNSLYGFSNYSPVIFEVSLYFFFVED